MVANETPPRFRNGVARRGSARFGPAFAERQGAGAERTAFAHAREGLSLGLDAVHRQPRGQAGDQHRADAIGPAVGALVRIGVDQQRIADVVPGQRDRFVEGVDGLDRKSTRLNSSHIR